MKRKSNINSFDFYKCSLKISDMNNKTIVDKFSFSNPKDLDKNIKNFIKKFG